MELSLQLPNQNNPFSEVTSDSISLKCQIMEVQVKNKLPRLDSERVYRLKLPDNPTAFQWSSETAPEALGIVFDAITTPTGSESPCITSCYGPLPFDTPLWWFLMWHTKEYIDPGSRFLELIYGLALVQQTAGLFHHVGYIECYSKEGKTLLNQVQEVPYREFTCVQFARDLN
jgi:hypothetical protein